MTVWPLGFDSATPNVIVLVPASPSPIVWSSTLTEGTGSSLVIVPTPWPSEIVAFVAPERLTRNVSSASFFVSPFAVTSIVFEDWPGVNVSTPDLEA